MKRSAIYLAALVLPSLSGASVAQVKPQPDPKAAPTAKAVQGVTVTGPGSELQTSIDRKSYSLAKDLQATTGSLADALRNIPSVEIDPQGRLSLRGDPNVTVLVDGKPSALFNGQGRAEALLQLPADQVDRVEVIPTPPASMTAEGSAGVINVIMKRARGAGPSGSLYALYGSQSGGRLGATFGFNSNRLNVTGFGAASYQRAKSTFTVDRTFRPDGAPAATIDDTIVGRNITRYGLSQVKASYALDPKTQLTGSAQWSQLDQHGDPQQVTRAFEAAGPVSITDHVGHRILRDNGLTLTAGLQRSFAGDGHQLSVDLTRSRDAPRERTVFFDVPQAPPGPLLVRDLKNNSTLTLTDLKATYARPLTAGAKLDLGYELRVDDDRFENRLVAQPSLALAQADATSPDRFRVEQWVHAVFGAYNRRLGDLTVQTGLRLEDAVLDLSGAGLARAERRSYVRAYPSLHLTYKLDEARQLSFSYARRVTRPPASLMDPFRALITFSDLQQGNPDLKPESTDAYEAGYQERHGQTSYLATAYYRRNRDEVGPVQTSLGGGLFLTTFENISSSDSTGLELTAARPITRTLSYSLSANLYESEIDARGLAGSGKRSASGVGARTNLNWQPTGKDFVQLNVIEVGERLLPQGVTEPNLFVNLGWRHKLNERMTLVLTGQDVLKTNHYREALDTPALTYRRRDDPVSRGVTLRLDYQLGAGKPAREPGFEYPQSEI